MTLVNAIFFSQRALQGKEPRLREQLKQSAASGWNAGISARAKQKDASRGAPGLGALKRTEEANAW
jgi:hypothetical protein